MTTYPKVFAVRQGGDSFLIELHPNEAVVLCFSPRHIRSPVIHPHSALKFGYWLPYDGALTAKDLIDKWNKESEGHERL